MTDTQTHEARSPIASKVLSSGNAVAACQLRVDVFAPRKGADGLWYCRYEFILNGVLDREGEVQGLDGVDAIAGAFWKIEIDLALRDRYSALQLQSDSAEGLGFINTPRVWESVYGPPK